MEDDGSEPNTPLGPVSTDPNWKRISAGLDVLDANNELLTQLETSVRRDGYSARLSRALTSLRTASTAQFADLHLRFLRLKHSQLERYRDLAERYQALSESITALCQRCDALLKQTAPVLDESPKRGRRSRANSGADKPSVTPPPALPLTAPAVGTASASASASDSKADAKARPTSTPPIFARATSPATTSDAKTRPGSKSSSPLSSPVLTPTVAPPPHFAALSASGTPANNPIGAAAAASPYALQQQMRAGRSPDFSASLTAGAPTLNAIGDLTLDARDGSGADGGDSDSKALAMAQRNAVPWTAAEKEKEEALQRAADAAALQRDVASMATMVHQIRDVFGDLSTLVESQQTPINEIQANIQHANESAKKGLSDIIKASRYKAYGMALTGGVMGALLGGPLGFVAGTKTGLGIGLVGGAIVGGGAGNLLGTSLRRDAKSAEEFLDSKQKPPSASSASSASASDTARAASSFSSGTGAAAAAVPASSSAAPLRRGSSARRVGELTASTPSLSGSAVVVDSETMPLSQSFESVAPTPTPNPTAAPTPTPQPAAGSTGGVRGSVSGLWTRATSWIKRS